MRVFSFAQESTRYCNYSKDKFGNELTFIIPSWLNLFEGTYSWKDSNPLVTAGMDVRDAGWDDYSNITIKEEDTKCWNEWKRPTRQEELFIHSLQVVEDTYDDLLNLDCIPQQARQVLPNALKTEVVMTGFVCDWVNFFKLRTSLSSHPDIRKLSLSLEEQFIEQNLIKP